MSITLVVLGGLVQPIEDFMHQTIRRLIGCGVGVAYAHQRAHMLEKYDEEGSILSIFSHNPSKRVFNDVVTWLLRQHFTFVSTDELIDGRVPHGRKAWLTFDDGWVSCRDVVLPLAMKYGIPFAIFVAPEETKRGEMWTAHVPDSMKPELYALPDEERYEAVDRLLAEIPTVSRPRRLLSCEEIKEMAQNPLVTIENHTYSHLSCAHRPTQYVMESIDKASRVLTAWTGRKPRMVCYPFGHWTDDVDNAVRDAGYIPVTIQPGVMTISRIGECRNLFYDNMSFMENSCRIVGAWRKIQDQKSGRF